MTGCRVAAEELAHDRSWQENEDRLNSFKQTERYKHAVEAKLKSLLSDDVIVNEVYYDLVEEYHDRLVMALNDDERARDVGEIICRCASLNLKLIAVDFVDSNWGKFI